MEVSQNLCKFQPAIFTGVLYYEFLSEKMLHRLPILALAQFILTASSRVTDVEGTHIYLWWADESLSVKNVE